MVQKGMDFAPTPGKDFLATMKPKSDHSTSHPESGMTLETIISIGVVGWLAIGMVLMGLGIW